MSDYFKNFVNSQLSKQMNTEHYLKNELESLLKLTTANNNPNINPLVELLRDIPIMKWNLKVHGYLLSKLLFGSTNILNLPVSNEAFTPKWSASISKDFFTTWFRKTCADLKIEPVLHRKIWELTYVLNNLEHYGLIAEESAGIGFGCGTEPLPSYFASKGINITATDLEPSNISAKAWINTDQHISDKDKIWVSDLCSKDDFKSRVSLRYEDMNNISSDLEGKFNFCWSICALEHLGSIEKGLDFIKRSLDMLKPGGIAIHTTEFNYSSDDKTIDNWPTVLFRKQDFLKLHKEIIKAGFEVPVIDFSVGDDPIDWFIDLPPFPWDKGHYSSDLPSEPHLKLSVDGFPTTCFGIVVRKPL